MMKKRTPWKLLFLFSMASYCSVIFIPQESKLYAMWLMPSKGLGFTMLMWAAKNLIMNDWDAFSAKRSKTQKQKRAKIEK